jgi:predicted O-methyltransferase YrrM
MQSKLPVAEYRGLQIISQSNRNMDIVHIDDNLGLLAQFFEVPRELLDGYYRDLVNADAFLTSLNQVISGLPSFHGKQFGHVAELHAYRSLLYLFTRTIRPNIFVETGVLNGFSSAFILLAMEHNANGKLVSIDLPSVDPEILDQGTGELPTGKRTGWAIPDSLRRRHDLRLGPAQELLPRAFAEMGAIDVFLHDSDHSYTHMMFEMSLAWGYLRAGGWVLVDNIEQNESFHDFVRATGSRKLIVNSYLRPGRTWQHGLAQKPSLRALP